MSMPVLNIWQLWQTAGSDFIKTNHQLCVEMIIQHHNICINLGTACGVLPVNIYSDLGCLQREKRLFTCRHADRSLTPLAHPASTSAALLKTTLCMVQSEWYGVTVFPLPAGRKECQKDVYLLMRRARSKTGHSCHIYYFRFTCHADIINWIFQPVLLGSVATDPKNEWQYSTHILPSDKKYCSLTTEQRGRRLFHFGNISHYSLGWNTIT